MLKPVKEIIYVFMRGQGWVPTIVREDVRHAAKRLNFGWYNDDPFYSGPGWTIRR